MKALLLAILVACCFPAFGETRIAPKIPEEVIDLLTRPPMEETDVRWVNHALGKPVHGRDGASHGKGLAKHVTDGDPATHAKPPASQFDYIVELATESVHGVHIGMLQIEWGPFGNYFKGIRNEDGTWASASWAGEYVNRYRIDVQQGDSQEWVEVHQWNDRPARESGPRVRVKQCATKRQGATSDVTTILHGLDLRQVTAIRIRGWGQHWVGLHELLVLGPTDGSG